MDAEVVRRRWPEVLATLRSLRMATWVLVSQNAQVSEVTATTVTLAFTTPQLATTFRTGPHPANLQRALHETLGLDARVETSIAAGATSEPAGARGRDGGESASDPSGPAAQYVVGDSAQRAAASWDAPEPDAASEPPDTGDGPDPDGPTAQRPTESPGGGRDAPAAAEPEATKTAKPARRRPAAGQAPAAPRPSADPSEETSPDDPELTESGMVGEPLVAQMLGGTVIDEVTEDD